MFGGQKAPDQPCTAVKDEAFLYGHHRTSPQVNRQVLAARHKEDTTGFDLMTEMIFGTAPELWGNLDFRPFLRQSASHPRSHKTGGPFRSSSRLGEYPTKLSSILRWAPCRGLTCTTAICGPLATLTARVTKPAIAGSGYDSIARLTNGVIFSCSKPIIRRIAPPVLSCKSMPRGRQSPHRVKQRG
jgi:hypothetical protein